MYRRLATNTVVNIVNLAFNIVINFALAPIFIRALGDEAYGIWVFVASLSVLRGFLRIFDLGIAASVIKFVAEYDSRRDQQGVNEVVSASLIVYSIVGLVASGALLLVGLTAVTALFNIPASQTETVRILLTWLAFQTIADFLGLTASGTLEGLQRYDITRGSNIVRLLLFAATSIAFLAGGLGVYALALSTTISELARIAIHVIWIRRLIPGLRLTWRVSGRVLRAIFSLSSKVFIFALANTVYEQMDKLIISVMLTTTLLTDYDISNRLHTLVFALTTMIGPFVVPMASSLQATNKSGSLRELYVRACLYSAVLTVPATFIMMVIVEPLTVYWLDHSYAHTANMTRLFVSYILVWYFLRIGQNMLGGVNRLERILPAFIGSIVVNLVVSVLAAQKLGLIGVVLGTVVGNITAFIPSIIVFRREFDLRWKDFSHEIILRVYPHALTGAFVVYFLIEFRYPASLVEVLVYSILVASFSWAYSCSEVSRIQSEALSTHSVEDFSDSSNYRVRKSEINTVSTPCFSKSVSSSRAAWGRARSSVFGCR